VSGALVVFPQASVTVRTAVPEHGFASGQVKVMVPVPPAPVLVAGEAAVPSEFANVHA